MHDCAVVNTCYTNMFCFGVQKLKNEVLPPDAGVVLPPNENAKPTYIQYYRIKISNR